MQTPLDQLKARLHTVKDLQNAAAVLEWDQETYMPSGATGARAHQLATLRSLAHDHFTADETGRLLEDLTTSGNLRDDDATAALLRVTQRDFDKATRLPTSLVGEMAQATGVAKAAWKQARAASDFDLFAVHLQRIVDLCRQKAECYGYTQHVYDALLDEYEPDMTTARVASVFSDLRQRLVPIVHALTEGHAPDDAVLHRHYDPAQQWDVGIGVLKDFGYDFNRGRQDRSAHPFTTTFSITDVRVTTRIDPDYFPTGLFGTLHEGGHALYEQGVNPAFDRTPLAEGTSLGMHESQSRLWENLVGRSRPFWEHYFPRLQQAFPDALNGTTAEAFYRAINRVHPSLIRVEADEVTYNLHVMLRFELEVALFDGSLAIKDLPDAWDAKMEDYLGRVPTGAADGCLQDIHWSLGALGYFPTYSLGNLMSVQIWEQAQQDLGDLDAQMARGEFAPLHDWLRTRIYRHGRARTATDLLHDITGSDIDAGPWLRYIETKYNAIYGL